MAESVPPAIQDSSAEVVIADGWGKFRDGKKWKLRWLVLSKLSPAADCLQLQIYRDEKERARNGHTKASLSLQHFLALESGFTLDKESHTLAIICQDLSVVLAFDNRERLIQWSVRIANNLGEGQQFLLQLASAPTKSKLTPGPVKLHVTDRKFCLTGGIPPRLLGAWEVSHLRRYGIVEGRLVFEGGSRCGKGEGVHVLVPDPPQIHLIIDAMDMSSKGSLTRFPSRRFGTGVDSPRKSLTSRLSELRSNAGESSANLSMNSMSTSCSTAASHALQRNMSPTPRESRSADELCTSCINGGPGSSDGHQNTFWMSSDSSSRCDLDSIDNMSMINCESSHDLKSQTGHSSPIKNGVNKPLPSAMERCLSCMSKLGAHLSSGGSDVLSPSWTMDLNGASSQGMSTSMSQSQVVPKTGSMGSGNSDRLSISSHGSSGGVTEFYYDTPRSVLMAEMRKNGGGHHRSATPPAPLSTCSGPSSANLSHHQHQRSSDSSCPGHANHHSGSHTPGPSSPQKMQPLRNNSSTCNSCHFHSHTQQHHHHHHQQSAIRHSTQPIYTNENLPEHQHHQQGKSHAPPKTPINLHSGPYENYDFPRCPPHQQQTPPTNPPSCCNSSKPQPSNIDWSKKLPMDRSSIASTALGSEFSEFYDTPRRCSDSVSNQSGCSSNGSAHHSIPCCASSAHQPLYHNQSQPGNSSKMSDPLENYDVPPSCNHLVSHSSASSTISSSCHQSRTQLVHSVSIVSTASSTNGRINGEGKMPLVAASTRSVTSTAPIYAQVDKSKKSHRSHPSMSGPILNCDNLHIYQNAQPPFPQIPPQPQPNYMNLDHSQMYPPKKPAAALPPPHQRSQSLIATHSEEKAHTQQNYANLDFTQQQGIYENSQDSPQYTPYESLEPPPPAPQAPSVLQPLEIHQPELVFDKTPTNPPSLDLLNHRSAKRDPDTTSLVHEDAATLPLRRSSSVPCKGGHANRGSASSSDSGVSGDGGLLFEDGSPLGDFGSLCLHESLPRKNQRSPPSTSTGGKNTTPISTPKPQDSFESEPEERPTENGSPGHIYALPKEEQPKEETPVQKCPSPNELIPNRHYETIAEVDSVKPPTLPQATTPSNRVEPVLLQRFKNHPLALVSDANSTSSGASDMSDYIETLSSCSRGSSETANIHHQNTAIASHVVTNMDISASPKRSTSMKPRSGKEYFKIDRALFSKTD